MIKKAQKMVRKSCFQICIQRQSLRIFINFLLIPKSSIECKYDEMMEIRDYETQVLGFETVDRVRKLCWSITSAWHSGCVYDIKKGSRV